MVVSLSEKKKFIKYILDKKFIRDNLFGCFFSSVEEFDDSLSKIDFITCSSEAKYDYKLFFNLRAKTFVCKIKGKVYKDKKLLRSILKLIYENDVKVCIMILDNNHQLKIKMQEVCIVSTFTRGVVTESTIDYGLKELNVLRLRKLIDKSLDERNEEDFMLYSKCLKELIG